MSRYKAYPEYKDSGIDWMDRSPSSWSSVTLRWGSRLFAGGTPSKDVESYWENGTIPWINSGEVNQGLICEASTYITEDAYKNSSAKWIPRGALVMALAGQGKTKGMVAQLAIDATCNQSMAAIVPLRSLNSRYLFWWLHSNYQNVRNMAGGDLRDGLNLDLIAGIGCPVPSAEEMKIIANFLDHETSKIDTLIAKQQELIKLLKEKRQAVISHAVTKGLNPNVPMRDSGVEWLGEVPAHWITGKCGYHFSFLSGFAFPSIGFSTNEENPKLLRGINVGVSSLKWNETVYWERKQGDGLDEFVLKDGDLVIGMDRPLISDGVRVSKVTSSDLPCLLLQRVALIRVHEDLLVDYIFRFLSSEMFVAHFSPDTTGVSVPHISPDQIKNFLIPLPPIEEQSEIVTFLDERVSRFERLISEAENAIELMHERRTALISAAVTGKIDVRDWQPPSESAIAA